MKRLGLLLGTLLLSGCFDGFQQVDQSIYRALSGVTATPTPGATATPVPTATPAPTATPTSTVTPTPTPAPLITMDTSLTFGSALTATDNTASNVTAAANGNPLWVIYADPWGVSSGTGHSSVAYSGSGSVTMSVNYTGLNDTGVNGYPFIGYGNDSYGYHNGNQAPQFPAQLSTMSSLVMDTVHSLSLTTAPGDLDVAYDEWLIPTSTYSGGPSGSVEVMVMYYYNFGYASPCTTIKTFTETITYNGTPTSMPFTEVECGSGGGGTYIAFFPVTNLSSGEVRFNLLDFLNEGASQSGVGTSWYLAGIDFGTEFGHAPSSVNYSMTVSKFGIEQTLK